MAMDWDRMGRGMKVAAKGMRRDAACELLDFVRLEDEREGIPGVIHVREIRTGREMYVTIPFSDEPSRAYKKNAVVQGNIIDERMRSCFQPGDYIVLENLYDFPDKGDTVDNPLMARYIKGLPNNPRKVVEGVMTIKGNNEHAFSVQVWEPQAVSLEEFKEQFGAVFDEAVKNYMLKVQEGRGPVVAAPGVQFRIIRGDELLGMSILLCDHSFDTDVSTEDRYKPLSVQEVAEGFASFRDWAKGKLGDDIECDIAVFKQYKASTYMVWKNERAPQAVMVQARAKLLVTDEEPPRFGGGVLACGQAVLKLSPGRVDPRTGRRLGEEHDFAVDIWVNGLKRHVHTFVQKAGGGELKLHPEMEVQKVELKKANVFFDSHAGDEECAMDEERVPKVRMGL
jgi:hypothetical protein